YSSVLPRAVAVLLESVNLTPPSAAEVKRTKTSLRFRSGAEAIGRTSIGPDQASVTGRLFRSASVGCSGPTGAGLPGPGEAGAAGFEPVVVDWRAFGVLAIAM